MRHFQELRLQQCHALLSVCPLPLSLLPHHAGLLQIGFCRLRQRLSLPRSRCQFPQSYALTFDFHPCASVCNLGLFSFGMAPHGLLRQASCGPSHFLHLNFQRFPARR